MIVLGIDSASGACSAAVLGPDGVRARRFVVMQRGQAEALAPMVRDVLAEAAAASGDISAVAVTVGPGAFTGVRIGLASARAFALAAALPVVGVTTFAAVSEPFVGSVDNDILAVIESRRADFFVQMIGSNGVPLAAPAALAGEEVAGYVARVRTGAPVIAVGDGAPRLIACGAMEGIDPARADGDGLPDAVEVARAARRIAEKNGLPDRRTRPSPLYLRPPDVKLPAPA